MTISRTKGFTLIELIVYMGLSSLLAVASLLFFAQIMRAERDLDARAFEYHEEFIEAINE